MQKTRPDWLEAALERYAPPQERAKGQAERARLQRALNSEDPAACAAAKAELKKPRR